MSDDGAPTKELYSMAGLVRLADFFGWDAQVSADNYMMHAGVQYALNIQPGVELSARTVERYQARFQNDAAAESIFQSATQQLVQILDLDVSRPRHNSTHVCIRMANFTCIGLMVVTPKRALTQIMRQDCKRYDTLPAELGSRLEPTVRQLFA